MRPDQGPDNRLTFADVRDRSNFTARETEVRYRSDGRFILTFTLWNGGSKGVKITDIPFEDGEIVGLGVRIGRPNDLGTPLASPLGRFTPFTLGAGDSRVIEAVFRFSRCPAAEVSDEAFAASNSATVWRMQRVDYEVLGIPRHVELELPTAVALRNPIHVSREGATRPRWQSSPLRSLTAAAAVSGPARHAQTIPGPADEVRRP